MDNRDRSILYQVAFKEAAAFVRERGAETDDIQGEVFALTDGFYENLATRIESIQGKAVSVTTPVSGPSSNGSQTQASTPTGNTEQRDVQIKEPDAPASDAQKNLLRRLKYAGNLDDLTKQQASDEIQRLKA